MSRDELRAAAESLLRYVELNACATIDGQARLTAIELAKQYLAQPPAAPSLEACVAALSQLEIDRGDDHSYWQGVRDSREVVEKHWPTAPAVEPPKDVRTQIAEIVDIGDGVLRKAVDAMPAVEPCDHIGEHHGDRCNGGRIQSPNAQFTRQCPKCKGTGKSIAAPAVRYEDVDLTSPSSAAIFHKVMDRDSKTGKPIGFKRRDIPVEPSEAMTLADRLAVSVTKHRDYHASSLCDDAAEAVDMLRSLDREITSLRKGNEIPRKGMESQAELMDGLKQQVREQEAEIAGLICDVKEWQSLFNEKATKAAEQAAEIASTRNLLDLCADAPLKLEIAKQTIERLRASHAEMVRRLEAKCDEWRKTSQGFAENAKAFSDDRYAAQDRSRAIIYNMAAGTVRSILAESAPKETPPSA